MYWMVCAVIFLIVPGIYYYNYQEISVIDEKVVRELSQDSQRGEGDSLAHAFSLVAQNEQGIDTATPMHQSRSPASETVESKVDQMELSDKERGLKESLGTDSLGVSFGRALLAETHSNEVEGLSDFREAFIQDLMASSDTSVIQLQTVLSRLPARQFPEQRAQVLRMMARLHNKDEEVKKLALDEMITSPSEGTEISANPENSLTVKAHRVFLEKTEDVAESLRGTIEGIASQPDPGIRSALAQQFLIGHPTLLDEFNLGLASRNIKFEVNSTILEPK